MSQRDGFAGGFLAGAVVGSLVGGVVGALIASGRASSAESEASLLNSTSPEAKPIKGRKRQLTGEESIEFARRSLEDKIAQLNAAIDEVRTQLSTVNGNALETGRERSLTKDS